MLAQAAVELDLLLDEVVEHAGISAALGLGDKRAELALAAFEVAALESMERVFDLVGERRLVAVVQVFRGLMERTREHDAGGLVRRSVERVGRRRGEGQGFQKS